MDKKISPWAWIPGLYVTEGLPYFAVNTITVLMYTKLGVSLKEMAFYTGWLYLPWVIKPFWSPFIDMFKSKRWWTITMQWLLGLCMAMVAFLLPGSLFFTTTLFFFWLMAFFSATHDIAADGFYMLALSSHEQAAYVGIRSTFYRIASVIGQGLLVILAGWIEEHSGSVVGSWQWVFAVMSIFFFCIALYNGYIMPQPKGDTAINGVNGKTIFRDFGHTFVTFFEKPHVWTALAFMMLYRLPEALCLKLIQPFLIGAYDTGGLGLSTSQVGFVNGTVGVIALLAGGILGGIAISRWGLKKCLWPMALSLTLPCIFYCWLATVQPSDFTWICAVVAIEQFGYGFGFSAYMLYLIFFSRGESQTSHYAFCTAFMALGMMIPGMLAGWIHEWLSSINLFGASSSQGYANFFWFVMAACIVTFIVSSMIKISPDFGLKKDR